MVLGNIAQLHKVLEEIQTAKNLWEFEVKKHVKVEGKKLGRFCFGFVFKVEGKVNNEVQGQGGLRVLKSEGNKFRKQKEH